MSSTKILKLKKWICSNSLIFGDFKRVQKVDKMPLKAWQYVVIKKILTAF